MQHIRQRSNRLRSQMGEFWFVAKYPLFSVILASVVVIGQPSVPYGHHPRAAQGVIVPITLARPVYPPIAVAARVTGEVEVKVSVRPDGSVDSTVGITGPPLLHRAAVEAAQQSRFECRECGEGTISYSVVYVFELAVRPTLSRFA